MSAVALRPLFKELGPQFERATSHKVVTKFVTGPLVQREVDAGEAFDVAITNPPIVDSLAKRGKVLAGTLVFARSGVGICVRAGARKPDIGSPDAFKRTLLSAASVSYSAQGTSGAYLLSLLDRLGISGDMKAKLKPQPGGAIPDAVARGEAELCITVMSQLKPIVVGAELVGPVPKELQTYIGFAAGIGAAAKDPEAARALTAFLATPAVASLLKDYGLDPPGT